MKTKEMRVYILGSEWRIVSKRESEDARLQGAAGLTDASVREIVIADVEQECHEIRNPISDMQRVLRHEIIHAFLFESGLWVNSSQAENWSMNEEMVDWIAVQLPKINAVCMQVGALPDTRGRLSE